MTDIYPWPARDGFRIRLHQMVRALCDCGDVDVFAAVGAYDGVDVAPPELPVARWDIVAVESARRDAALARRTLTSAVPRRILWKEWAPARARLAKFARGPYDVVWYSHSDPYVALGDRALGPAIVDHVDVEHRVLQARSWRALRSAPWSAGSTSDARELARVTVRRLLDRRDARRWRRLQPALARAADASVVCSETDRELLGGGASMAVVPNGYDDPGPPAAGSLPAEPVLLMVGRFTYDPNPHGAIWFVSHVLPLIRERVPGVRVRFVGRHDERLEQVREVPGVSVVGEVEDVGGELRAARAVIVPLWEGSGTRIKIVEAFAYGLPVVTTSLGCEGLAVEHGVQALVADDPAAFARSCVEVLVDDALAGELAAAGRRRFVEAYDWANIRPKVGSVAQSVARAGAAARSGPVARRPS